MNSCILSGAAPVLEWVVFGGGVVFGWFLAGEVVPPMTKLCMQIAWRT